MADILWKDRKRIFCGLPWTFTRYSLTQEKLVIDTGFLRRNEEEVRLYRVLDVTLKRGLVQRIFGLGTIHCCTADKTAPEFDIKNIKQPVETKNLLSDLVEEERSRKRVSGREFMMGEDDTEMDLT
ncbi:MAG: PH domain-containing protein [Clostridia bacterium]|nr:PH domain-containing protein [Clostridia bacterium]